LASSQLDGGVEIHVDPINEAIRESINVMVCGMSCGVLTQKAQDVYYSRRPRKAGSYKQVATTVAATCCTACIESKSGEYTRNTNVLHALSLLHRRKLEQLRPPSVTSQTRRAVHLLCAVNLTMTTKPQNIEIPHTLCLPRRGVRKGGVDHFTAVEEANAG